MSNTTLAPIQFTQTHADAVYKYSQPTVVKIVPLKCGSKTLCHPVIEEEKILLDEVSCGQLRLHSGAEVRSFDFLTSTYGGRIPRRALPVQVAEPFDACSPIKPVNSTATGTATDSATSLPGSGSGSGGVAVLVSRGSCSFDLKSFHAEQAGASLVIVVDMNDTALQRLGGKQPLAGGIGVPTIMVPTPCGQYILQGIDSGSMPTVTLTPAEDSNIANKWIELAYTDWSEDDEEDLLTQIEGLVQKYIQHNDINTWLRRKADRIRNKRYRMVNTDEL